MIKHVVLFKFKSDIENSTKQQKMIAIRSDLLALKETINELRSVEVGININPEESYDIALTTTFDSMEALKAYAIHPDHDPGDSSKRQGAGRLRKLGRRQRYNQYRRGLP